MEQILLIIHIMVSIALIGLVLIQKGKGAGMGAAFGSGASQTVFGSRGNIGFLMKLTVFLAAVFFITSISLTYIAAHQVKQSGDQGLLTNVEQISKQVKESSKHHTTPALPAQKANKK